MIRKILFIMLLCGSFLVLNEKANADPVQSVSIINLIATPEKYDGKLVRIFGFVRLEFEGIGIYLTEVDLKNYLGKNGLWLDGIEPDEWKKYNNNLCLVEGVFDAKNTGHMGAFSGAIKNVSRIQTWKMDQK